MYIHKYINYIIANIPSTKSKIREEDKWVLIFNFNNLNIHKYNEPGSLLSINVKICISYDVWHTNSLNCHTWKWNYWMLHFHWNCCLPDDFSVRNGTWWKMNDTVSTYKYLISELFVVNNMNYKCSTSICIVTGRFQRHLTKKKNLCTGLTQKSLTLHIKLLVPRIVKYGTRRYLTDFRTAWS